MTFENSAVSNEIADLARKFAQKELLPIVQEDEQSERFRPEIIHQLGQLGLTGVAMPEEYGGAGLGYLEYVRVIEEISRVSSAYGISIAVTGLPQLIISKFGSDEQKKKVLPTLCQGKGIGAFSLSEASSGSDAANLKTSAKKDGNNYVINGTKLWTTQADVADFILLMARTGEVGSRGISSFIIEKGTKGLEFGKREKKMGLHTSHTLELILNDVRIPKENLVGQEGDGFKIALTALDSGRITIAANALGISKEALSVAVNHSKQREQFGKPISEFQGVSFMLADMATQIDASELLIKRAAWLRDQSQPFTREAAMAKLFTTDTAMRVTTDAVQVLGGSGYTQDFPLERFMREAKVMQIVEGTNQIQRLVISRSLTRGES